MISTTATKNVSSKNSVESINESSTLAQILKAARSIDETGADGLTPVRFSVLRNVTLEPGLPAILKIASAKAGLAAAVHLGGFDDIEPQVFNGSSSLYASAPSIVIVALQLQTIAPRLMTRFASLSPGDVQELSEAALARMASIVSAIRQHCGATILVHNFEKPVYPAYGILDAQMPQGQRRTIASLNEKLADTIADISGAYIVDVERLVGEIGYNEAIDQRYWHIARAPYTLAFQHRLAREYVSFASALKGKAKKCLVLDCDNTLWGGIVGEDGLEGIALSGTAPGSAFLEMHAAVLDLYERGVLLAVASKNNEEDVLEVFATHPSSLLKPEHFVAKRISWQDKATSLREIADELNIGIDSLVFVDDSSFECAFVRQSIPAVTVVELPKDPSSYAALIRSLPYFETLALSAEDRRRSEMYRADATRKEMRESLSIDDYLRSLSLKLTIGLADPFSIPRISQLTQKTNQFNLTTRRYSESEVERMASDPRWRIFHASLSDRFDDAGLVAIALVYDEDSYSRLDTLLMSCRVFGRGVEYALIAEIAKDCAARGATELVGEYIATPKNELAASFLGECGFTERRDDATRPWSLDLKRDLPTAPEWFAEIVRRPELDIRSLDVNTVRL